MFDVAVSVAVLLLAVPILVIAALAIKLESPGPALFRQPRMGRNGRPFRIVKLRGMYGDARTRFPSSMSTPPSAITSTSNAATILA